MAKVDRSTQQATITANIKDNTEEFITPAREREVMENETDSALYAIDDTGTDGQIPVTNATDDGFSYSSALTFIGNVLSTAALAVTGNFTVAGYIEANEVRASTIIGNPGTPEFTAGIKTIFLDATGQFTMYAYGNNRIQSDTSSGLLWFWENKQNLNTSQLWFLNVLEATADTGDTPITREDFRGNNAETIANRPLKEWTNDAVSVLQLGNDGGLTKDGTNALQLPKGLTQKTEGEAVVNYAEKAFYKASAATHTFDIPALFPEIDFTNKGFSVQIQYFGSNASSHESRTMHIVRAPSGTWGTGDLGSGSNVGANLTSLSGSGNVMTISNTGAPTGQAAIRVHLSVLAGLNT